jgi:Mlc titration factor MtfA (ptsG expression regulator)
MRLPFAFIPPEILFLLLLAVVVGWWLVMRLRRKAGIWRLRYYAFPRPWLKHLHDHVPHYARLPWELRAPYQDKVLNFVDSKIFRPGGSMGEVTEELRVTIAGNACLLLLNSPAEVVFPTILTVQVYPQNDEDPTARSSAIAVLWDDKKGQATHPADRENSALAEITARLGLKALPEPLLLTGWARVLCPDFERSYPGMLEKIHSGEAGDVFAMATEVFLAAPAVLQQSQPALYDALRHFYRVDPSRWSLKK